MKRLAMASAAGLASLAIFASPAHSGDAWDQFRIETKKDAEEAKVDIDPVIRQFIQGMGFMKFSWSNRYSADVWESVAKVIPREFMVPDQLESYAYLVDAGFPLDSLKQANVFDASQLADGFRHGRWDYSLKDSFAKPEDILAYSRRAAEGDEHFKDGMEWVKEHLKQRLSKNKHAYRRWCDDKGKKCDYLEVGSNVDRVHDQHLLFLIKEYMDYFDSPAAGEDMKKLFPKKEGSPENGGIFFFRDGRMEFYFVPNENPQGEYATSSYLSPNVSHFIPHIGNLHTHPKEKGVNPIVFAGPSGYSKVYKGMALNDALAVDLGGLRELKGYELYNIDAVVTQMGRDKYDVDLYFRDLEPLPGGNVFWPFNAIVLDLGVYRYK